ncbi:hypothetical protein FOZ63_012957 [Perkinsus olseni]|uniref:Uncharacterized protein n=2 Tax=Perkinsus olseni TaxID=32597 RepID=A0A7J6S3M9_PEROL|nr:hypothetical protein FOZ63_012957 [Perkinsus olseni]
MYTDAVVNDSFSEAKLKFASEAPYQAPKPGAEFGQGKGARSQKGSNGGKAPAKPGKGNKGGKGGPYSHPKPEDKKLEKEESKRQRRGVSRIECWQYSGSVLLQLVVPPFHMPARRSPKPTETRRVKRSEEARRRRRAKERDRQRRGNEECAKLDRQLGDLERVNGWHGSTRIVSVGHPGRPPDQDSTISPRGPR